MEVEYGIISILPALLAIVLAIATRQVIASLFVAVWVGATILNNYNPFTGFLRTLDTHMLEKVADPWYVAILIFTMVMAGALGLVTKAGGAQAIADALARRAKSPRGGMLAAWLMGMIVFFDDYSSCIIAGNTVRPVTDKLRISREKLSYIVDSTAAPVATIAIISTWIGYELGLITDAYAKIGQPEVNAFLLFLQSIPYRFYSIFALGMVLVLSIMVKDFGPMYNAEIRARSTGKVIRDGGVPLTAQDMNVLEVKQGTPLRWINFVLPVATMIIGIFATLYYLGGGPEVGIREAFGAADSSIALLYASSLGALVALVMVLAQRLLSLGEAIDALINGAKSVYVAIVILVLAWTLSSVSSQLGAADFLVGIVEAANVPYQIIPLLIFLVCCVISFAMGTSWGTMGIVMPLAIPIAAHFNVEYLYIPILASVLTGAIFGDHCSPISDTTILSSIGSGSDHIDHVRTQLPYALVAGAVAAVFGFIPAGFGAHPLISIVLGVIALIVVVKLVGKSTQGPNLDTDSSIKA